MRGFNAFNNDLGIPVGIGIEAPVKFNPNNYLHKLYGIRLYETVQHEIKK